MPEKRISFRGHSPGKSNLVSPRAGEQQTVFLLSPANMSSVRARLLLNESSQSQLSQKIRSSQAMLGEVFSFVSGLYFRGKLAYATRFANPPQGLAGIRVITATSGLLPPEHIVTLEWLRAAANSLVHPDNPEYRNPLLHDAQQLNDSLPPQAKVVLLGSIATPKYVEPLLGVFGERLFFPAEFVGRGDMSRGSLLLRCTREDVPLVYARVTFTGLSAKKRSRK